MSCRREPSPAAPPAQRTSNPAPDPPELAFGDHVAMVSPWIHKYIVSDIDTTPNAPRRWTFANPEMRFVLKDKSDRKLVANFVVVSQTFKETGPFHLEFVVNGRSVGTANCDRPEEMRFETKVPRQVLELQPETRIRFVVDKYWIAPSDHNKLGVQLVDVGFYPL